MPDFSTLAHAVEVQSEALDALNRNLSNFATTADLEERIEGVEHRQGEMMTRRFRRLFIRVTVVGFTLAVLLAGIGLGVALHATHQVSTESRNRALANCAAENDVLARIRSIINEVSKPLPINPSAPPAIQQQVRERNAATAAFRAQTEATLTPANCQTVASGEATKESP